MQAAHGLFVLIQSTAEPHSSASTSANRRIVAFGEHQIVDISLYNGRLKVEDVFARAAEALRRPAYFPQPLAVYYLDEVIGGTKHYCLMRAVDGFYHTEFSMGTVHELYLYCPPPETITITLSDHGRLMDYIKWKNPGEDDRILALPDEVLDDPNVSRPGYEDLESTVRSVSLNYADGQRMVSEVVMPILRHAARVVSFPEQGMGSHKMLDVRSNVAVGKVPVMVISGGVEKRILLNGRLDTVVYHKSELMHPKQRRFDLNSVLLVVAIKAGHTGGNLSPNDEYVRHTIAQAYAVLERRRTKGAGFPNSPSQRTHFVVVNGQTFRFGCLERTGDGALLPHLSDTVSLDVHDETGEPRNLPHVFRCLIWILERAVLTSPRSSTGEVDNDPSGGGALAGGGQGGERRGRDSVEENEGEEAHGRGGGDGIGRGGAGRG